ncbi:MarR family winged helix-turn-helix transcriptional regulator [Seohaeicola zhoushanensis]|uniref:Transcriptional regulator n=1 Tax=Seohaeicola zhoushanensis TaxID=1569283 RepID=A0A8J3GV41_9RHOB|nr:MarR family transcriptional regulator [Seohaeicola zhoushanensis]GHF42224.1 transcriptional regulator [Seohaeicola zhoushanensis]
MSVKPQKPTALPESRAARLERLDRTIRAASAQRTLYSGVLASKLGLHQTDLECLFIITLGEKVTPGRLAQETGLTTGAITGVVDRIERAGYIRRVRDTSDRRRLFLEPVAEKIEEIRAINRRAYHAWIRDLARYSEEELDILLDFADRNYEAAVNATIKLRRESRGEEETPKAG